MANYEQRYVAHDKSFSAIVSQSILLSGFLNIPWPWEHIPFLLLLLLLLSSSQKDTYDTIHTDNFHSLINSVCLSANIPPSDFTWMWWFALALCASFIINSCNVRTTIRTQTTLNDFSIFVLYHCVLGGGGWIGSLLAYMLIHCIHSRHPSHSFASMAMNKWDILLFLLPLLTDY